MSNSVLYKVNKSGAKPVAMYSNGWGSAAVLWDMMCVKYLNEAGSSWMMNEAIRNDLWNLSIDDSIPFHIRICHAMCLDYSIVKYEDLKEVSECCHKTYEDIKNFPSYIINHWQSIGNTLLEISNLKKKNCFGYGLTAITVNDLWVDYSKSEQNSVFDAVKYVKTKQ